MNLGDIIHEFRRRNLDADYVMEIDSEVIREAVAHLERLLYLDAFNVPDMRGRFKLK